MTPLAIKTSLASCKSLYRLTPLSTLNFALRGAENEYRIKHANSYKVRMEEVVRALKVEESYVDSFKVRADQLLGRTMSVDICRD